MVLVIQSSSQASCSMSVIKHPPHAWDGGPWLPPSSPSVTLSQIQ